jgi:hypothetical protein
VIAQCEIGNAPLIRCQHDAVSWCRACDRAMCASHRRLEFDETDWLDRCSECVAAGAQSRLDVEAAYRAALADIAESIRELHRLGSPGARVAYKYVERKNMLTRRSKAPQPLYSIRYWPVGTFSWAQSGPGGYGEHELNPLGVHEFETVVNDRGQITRADEAEVVAGRALLAALQSEQTVVVLIARNLRGFLLG